MSWNLLPSYSHHKTLEPLKNKAPHFDYESKGRGFESRRAHFPEAKKIKASGIFYAVVLPTVIVVNCEKSESTPIITPIIVLVMY